jgi:hypothetical protein
MTKHECLKNDLSPNDESPHPGPLPEYRARERREEGERGWRKREHGLRATRCHTEEKHERGMMNEEQGTAKGKHGRGPGGEGRRVGENPGGDWGEGRAISLN